VLSLQPGSIKATILISNGLHVPHAPLSHTHMPPSLTHTCS